MYINHQTRKNVALLVTRVVVGVIFIAHALMKLQTGVGGFAVFLEGMDVPAAGIMAWVVTLVELLGGVALILGFWTCIAGGLLVINMIVAITLVKVSVGLIAPMGGGAGAELDLALLAGALSVALLGPGSWSVDAKMKMGCYKHGCTCASPCSCGKNAPIA